MSPEMWLFIGLIGGGVFGAVAGYNVGRASKIDMITKAYLDSCRRRGTVGKEPKV